MQHDLLSRLGHLPDAKSPCVIGHEIAGTVEEVGELVRTFHSGQRVALTQRISCGVLPHIAASGVTICAAQGQASTARQDQAAMASLSSPARECRFAAGCNFT
jgi:D-arabinose 1-dehydrogenase-like Zn-dependent alcohol dehydrogenase